MTDKTELVGDETEPTLAEELRHNAMHLSDFTVDAHLMRAAANRIETLEAALRPFAEMADYCADYTADKVVGPSECDTDATVADVRHAAAVLGEK